MFNKFDMRLCGFSSSFYENVVINLFVIYKRFIKEIFGWKI